jgi:hypothetical protein
LSRLGSKKANQTSNLYLPEPKVKAFKWCTEKKKGLELQQIVAVKERKGYGGMKR